MRLFSRQVVRFGILLLAVRVVMDMATPHSPGAFRLDPLTSVQAAGAPLQAIAVAVPAQPSRSLGRAITGHIAHQRF
ncbi:MAG: hypothetical protein ACRDHF_02305 [Tepidiformaceae bacterium]